MVKSTSQFVKEIRTITPKENHKFYKMDVKYYFMSGDAIQLVDDAIKIADEKTGVKELASESVGSSFELPVCCLERVSRTSMENTQRKWHWGSHTVELYVMQLLLLELKEDLYVHQHS